MFRSRYPTGAAAATGCRQDRLARRQCSQLSDRINRGALRQCEYRWLAQRCIDLLGREDSSVSQIQAARSILTRIEVAGRAGRKLEPWASWALVSEIDRDGAVDALVGLLEHDDPAVRLHGVWALGMFGEEARRALPALFGQLGSEERVHRATLWTLGQLEKEGLWERVRWIEGSFHDVQLDLFWWSLGKCGTEREQAIPILIDGLESDSPAVRATSVFGLAVLGVTEPEHVRRIVQLGDDENSQVRLILIRSLGSFPLIEESKDILREGLNDGLGEAVLAVASLGGEGACLRDNLRRMLASTRDETVARAFVAVGGDPHLAIDVLLEAASAASGSARADALETVGRIGVESPTAVREVEPWLSDDHASVRGAAAYALAMAGGDADGATRALVDMVIEGSAGAARNETRLEWLAESGHLSASVLAERFADESAPARALAARLIGYAAGAAEYLPRLRELTDDPDPAVADQAANAIRRIRWRMSPSQ